VNLYEVEDFNMNSLLADNCTDAVDEVDMKPYLHVSSTLGIDIIIQIDWTPSSVRLKVFCLLHTDTVHGVH